jgi:hypothetical protein
MKINPISNKWKNFYKHMWTRRRISNKQREYRWNHVRTIDSIETVKTPEMDRTNIGLIKQDLFY